MAVVPTGSVTCDAHRKSSGTRRYMIISQGILLSIGSAVVFGLYPAAAKRVYLEGGNPQFVILVTTCARALALIAFCIATQRSFIPEGKRIKPAVVGGVCQCGSIFGIIVSLQYIPAPITIIVMFLHTVMILLYSALKGEIQCGAKLIIITIAALCGIGLVVDAWSYMGGSNLLGLVLALFAASMTAIRLYVFGKEVHEDHPIVVGAQVFLIAAIIASLLTLGSGVVVPRTVAGLNWTVVCSFALITGTFGMFYGIAQLGSFQWSLMAKLEPVFTTFFALLLLGESLSNSQYLGMAVILGSLVWYQLSPESKKVI
jgi:drug/metabolite transporter (DMT)-like permease